jgi:hypothetical protein
MANNIAVKITADVADLTAKRAIMSAELKAATRDLNDFAKTARTGGMTDALRADMLKAGEAVAKARAQIRGLDTEMKSLGEHKGAGLALNNLFDRSRPAVLEAGTAKMPIFGSAIEALGPAGMVAAGGLAAMAFAAEKAVKAAEWAEQLKRAATTLGFTTTQLQEFDFALNAMGIDVERGRQTLSGLEKTIGLVESGLARSMQVKAFTDALKITPEDLRGWGTLEEQLPHILDALAKLDPEERAAISQRLKIDPEVVTSMIEARGRLSDLIAEAHKYGIVISADVIDKSAESAGKMREWKAIIDGELRVSFIELAPVIAGAASAVAHAAEDFADFIKGVEHVLGPLADFATWTGKAIGAANGLGGAISDTVDRMVPMLGPLREIVGLLKQMGHADTVAADKLNTAKDKPKTDGPKPVKLSDGSKKAKGPGIVSQWTEQLHAQEVASKNYFGDQTATELAFWQKKLALTKTGSKEWLEVQSKIYDASKKLAHDAFNDQIAALGDQIEAEKNNWGAEKATWDEKLALIRKNFGDQSREYHTAHKEFEAAERQHQHTMLEIQRGTEVEALAELKSNFAAAKAIREQNAKTAEGSIQQGAKTSANPLAGVQADMQMLALHKQLDQQQLAADQALYAAEDKLRQQDIVNAVAADGLGAKSYHDAINAKKLADQEFYNKHRELENQMVQRQVQDQQRIAASWHSSIDPVVSATGGALLGLINHTLTWRQALLQIGQSIEGAIMSAIEKMVANWIVGMITGQAATATTATAQALSNAAVAGSAAYASTAMIPIIGPELAPAAAAAAYAGAASYAALASFDVGTNLVPNDMIAQIHAGERIIPAADNAALMSAVNGNSAGGGSGDNHFHSHYSPTVNGGSAPSDLKSQMDSSSRDHVRVLKGLARSGQLNKVMKAAGRGG